ncbi:PTS sugar transporter subunit IIB [Paraliobacillus salinarum]|uniref:PTS sugar transporter subunit IIB n=1 Tax=Paraliobacillus salinarum TaxID=1158996 RepID=UPI0015F7209E|nr:PTS sugar transporter subunit IIB [Paraliobacillus salinarum]
MKIYTVCGMGFGTSLMVKMTIDDILADEGIKANVEAIDMGSAKGIEADLFITSKDMLGSFPEVDQPVIYLENMTDKNEIKQKLNSFFNEQDND